MADLSRPIRAPVTELVEACLASYAEWEPQLHAFSWFDPELARSLARAVGDDAPPPECFLQGLPVGVKDIFDTKGIPTEFGSPIFAGRIPQRTAVAVERLQAAGALVFGKTVTSELAYYAAGPTTNPWDSTRTPGGSSMGSAAAVAAGVIPAAIGTQTNGSVIRPAAFCGVVGFKPSARRIPTAGCLRFSPTLDQVGVFAATVSEAGRLAAVAAGESHETWVAPPPRDLHPVLGVVRTPEWNESEPAVRERFESALGAADAAGASLLELEMPQELCEAIPILRMIMAAEAAHWIRPLVASALARCSPELVALLDEGADVAPSEAELALSERERLIAQFSDWVEGSDALVTLSVLGEAPPLETTGDPRCCTRWTLVGAPAVTLPNGLGPNNLPLAVQLVGTGGQDEKLVGVASWLESLLPSIGPPPRPTEAVSRPTARLT